MRKPISSMVRMLLILNTVSLLGFLGLFVVRPLFIDLDVRMNYTQLDRAGVINESALSQFHSSYGFSDSPRNSVPRYIAGAALAAEKLNAFFGICLAGVNLLLIIGVCFALRRASKAAAKGTT